VAPSAAPPRRPREDVIGDVRGRTDVGRLDAILGGLAFDAVFVPQGRKWLVTARDASGRLVRAAVVADEK